MVQRIDIVAPVTLDRLACAARTGLGPVVPARERFTRRPPLMLQSTHRYVELARLYIIVSLEGDLGPQELL